MAFLCVQLQALNDHGFGQQCDGVPVCTTTSTERTTGLDSSAMAFLCVQLQALNVPRVWTAVRWRCGGCCMYLRFGQQCDVVAVGVVRTTGLDSSAMALRWVLYVPRVWTAVRWRCGGCCTYLGFGQQCDGVAVGVVRTTGLDSSAMALRWVLYVPRVWTAVRWRCGGCCTCPARCGRPAWRWSGCCRTSRPRPSSAWSAFRTPSESTSP